MVKRVSSQQIVKPAPVVVSIDNPDAIFIKDNSDIIFTKESGYSLPGAAIGAFNLVGSAGSAAPSSSATTSTETTAEAAVQLPPDVPSLADIESITYEEYPDATGVAKYKAIIKIRNSSRDKSNVEAVDARIYNPSGSSSYSFTTTQVASGASKPSSYVSNTTWYNANSSYDPIGGYILSQPAIVGNAQYPSDGSTVPADSTTGPTRNRIKSAWRKTQAEALAAVSLSSLGLI